MKRNSVFGTRSERFCDGFAVRTSRPPDGCRVLAEIGFQIKHDGFRLMACRQSTRIRALTSTAMTGHRAGASFEIWIDGRPRAYCARKEVAIEAAECLKQQDPHSKVVVKDLESGGLIVMTYKADRPR